MTDKLADYRGAIVVAFIALMLFFFVDQKTADRYTGSQAARDWEIQHGVDERQDFDIQALRRWIGWPGVE